MNLHRITPGEITTPYISPQFFLEIPVYVLDQPIIQQVYIGLSAWWRHVSTYDFFSMQPRGTKSKEYLVIAAINKPICPGSKCSRLRATNESNQTIMRITTPVKSFGQIRQTFLSMPADLFGHQFCQLLFDIFRQA